MSTDIIMRFLRNGIVGVRECAKADAMISSEKNNPWMRQASEDQLTGFGFVSVRLSRLRQIPGRAESGAFFS
eukprot:scaffold8192_cov267-Pinguiococcus_pyrenoidosus.AAC.2